MSDLLQDILEENNVQESSCRIRLILESLSTGDKTALVSAFNNAEITSAAIERALKKNGHPAASSTVRRHRRGECSCGKLG